MAHLADWCFVLARTEPGSHRHAGLSFLLVPMDQPGVEVRPIRQLTGTSEFNEVFFSGARTSADLVVGEPGDGWRVAMGLLGFERGVSTIGQQVGFARELSGVLELARRNGAYDDPVLFDRLARAVVGLDVMRANALRTLAENLGSADAGRGQDNIAKLVWASWHKELGALAMDVLGDEGLTADAERRADRVAAAVPLQSRRHDLRRLRRDPAEHPRRAGARPSPRAQGREHDDQPAHGAAGARLRSRPRSADGQGRGRHRGRRSRHRRGRRPSRARGRGAGRRGGRHARAPLVRSDKKPGRGVRGRTRRDRAVRRDRRGPGQRASRRGRALRRRRRHDQQRRSRRDGEHPGDDRRAVDQGPRHHADRHLPVRPRRRQPHGRRRQEGRRSSTTPRSSAGGPRRARRTTPRRRPASWR